MSEALPVASVVQALGNPGFAKNEEETADRPYVLSDITASPSCGK